MPLPNIKSKVVIFACIFSLTLLLAGCGHSDDKSQNKNNEAISIAPNTLSTQLFFSGTIQPLKTMVVTSPVDGVVDDMTFHYGDNVKPGQLLFTVSSEKFKTDYKTALMAFIKAKNDFTTAKSQLAESKFLIKNQLISDDDFKSKQSAFYNAQLSLIQAQDAMTVLLKQLDVPDVNLSQLSIDKIDKITQALHIEDGAQKLHVQAPVAGVALVQVKSSSTDDAKKVEKGDQVKQGDVLVSIGNISGFLVHIEVNEFNINQLKMGQKVKVTGPAFSDFVLNGEITGIDRQGETSQGGLPIFPVDVVVPTLTPEEQAEIHIGMSAKVEIDIESDKKITVPIAAVYEKSNQTYVKVKNKFGKSPREVAVKTGETTEDSVVIESGLNSGDEVIVAH